MPRAANNRKRVLIQCSSLVNRDAISRRNINGVEHIVVQSHTLPDDVVMNGGLYPADEIANSYSSLERTLAPVEHPQDDAGNFISASDPVAIHNFYAGAFNENVTRNNGRVTLDKVINVQEALKTDRGKRLLDRITELETNDNPRPIHTSTGIFLEVEETDGVQTNAQGLEYTWVARNMVFDHDAILLDSVGAARPNQGVGMGVNSHGDSVDVQQFTVNTTQPISNELSHDELRQRLHEAVNTAPLRADWVIDVFDDRVIYTFDDSFFEVSYSLAEDDTVTITSLPTLVDRTVKFTPKTNLKGDPMKDLMLKALADAGVAVNADISDTDLLAKYNELNAAEPAASNVTEDIAAAVTNAIKPLNDKIESLETKLNEQDDEELERLANIVGNSDKYPGLNAEGARSLTIETLKEMAANCGTAHGIPQLSVVGNSDELLAAPTEMPK